MHAARNHGPAQADPMHTLYTRLLLGGLLGSLGSGTLLLLALVAGLGASETEGAECLGLLLLGGDGAGLLGLVDDGQRGDGAGDVRGEVLALLISSIPRRQSSKTHLSVTGLGHTLLLGEHDEPGAVLLQAVDVELLALLRLGAAALVNDNAEALGLLLGDASKLELGDGETAAL